MHRIVVFAPNWLGDAVVAVPCVNAIRRHYPSAVLAVAARSHLTPLVEMVNGVDEVVCLERAGRLGGWLSGLRDARRLRAARFDVAILLPNSFRAAWIARRARIAERWGYATDARSRMLTRAVPRLRGGHQVEYYARLLNALGIPTGRNGSANGSGAIADLKWLLTPLEVPGDARQWAREVLASKGWKAGEPLVGMAPGAAYGSAKQWPPERFAHLALELATPVMETGALSGQGSRPTSFLNARTVLVGSTRDRAVCEAIARIVAARLASAAASRGTPDLQAGWDRGLINLAGATDLRQLAGIMGECRSFVSNDSGAMHLAAAVGVPVVGIFGSTNEKETAPLSFTRKRGKRGREEFQNLPAVKGVADTEMAKSEIPPDPFFGVSHAVVASDVWCRPCMLRECPLDHACMTGIDVARVKAEVMKHLDAANRG